MSKKYLVNTTEHQIKFRNFILHLFVKQFEAVWQTVHFICFSNTYIFYCFCLTNNNICCFKPVCEFSWLCIVFYILKQNVKIQAKKVLSLCVFFLNTITHLIFPFNIIIYCTKNQKKCILEKVVLSLNYIFSKTNLQKMKQN